MSLQIDSKPQSAVQSIGIFYNVFATNLKELISHDLIDQYNQNN